MQLLHKLINTVFIWAVGIVGGLELVGEHALSIRGEG